MDSECNNEQPTGTHLSFTNQISKESQTTKWKPTYAKFDLGKHYHIGVHSITQSKNDGKESFNTLQQTDSTESIITLTMIEYLWKCLQYCVRYGIQLFYKYEHKITKQNIWHYTRYRHTTTNRIKQTIQ